MHLFDYCPWLYWTQASEEDIARQQARQLELPGLREAGERTYLSPLAAIYELEELAIGSTSYIAAHAYVTGRIRLGDNTTVNPFAVVRGTVTAGDGVRIGAHASILGFNHAAEPAEPVFRQPITSKGITIEDDVWIGSNAVILDGVTVGAHSIIGAGAVVTKDVPPWSVMGGNPARRIRDRRDRKRPLSLESFGQRAREEAPALLAHYDFGWGANVRAVCDAVEIADLLGVELPREQETIEWLKSRQDPETGLIPELGEASPTLDSGSNYHILSVGYALDLLGSQLPHPIRAVHELDDLIGTLDALPWADRAWHAGAWVDMYGTGLHWNRRLFGLDGPLETLLGWLLTRQDPWSGLWGSPTLDEGRRQPVNGYYRLTRGTFAQFGVPVPRPEATIDAVLAHTRDGRFFADGRGTACDVLDVIHPLWLCGQQTGHRRAEAQSWARQRLGDALTRWQPERGFAFSPEQQPSLMGTEMWLAIIWLLADILGESAPLGYHPRGVHRDTPPSMDIRS
ncbi:acyltransferase [Allorhizocola rhizosphaerae]|uniref:acyltransferase n=1 Tax=Allorhizocola rhizosphaerae TaxID=1872709 RepID=UPI001FE95AD9|nr:acyltransferase [Allorhizocola rhizosphaerae]